MVADVGMARASDRVSSAELAHVDVRHPFVHPVPRDSSHDRRRYEFSIGPWRWVEVLWPNFSGRLFPQNERWIRVIPAEGRTWAPSLYFGILPLLLCGRSWRLWGRSWVDVWLSWLALIGVLGSLGRFGLGWLAAELSASSDGVLAGWHHETGGLYWGLVQILPGFHVFRYPAKLWTWTAIALSLLAVRSLDEAMRKQQSPIAQRWLVLYTVCSGLMFLFIVALGSLIQRWWSVAPSDSLFGPLAISAARRHLAGSFAHGAVVGTATLLLLRGSVRRTPTKTWSHDTMPAPPQSAGRGWYFVAITAVELSVANHWMIATAPAAAFDQSPGIKRAAGEHSEPQRPSVFRLPTQGWYPQDWKTRPSPDRLVDCITWDRWTARPKYPMVNGLRSLRGSTSFSTSDQVALISLLDELQSTDVPAFTMLLQQLGIDFVCGPSAARVMAPHVLSVDRPRPWLSDAMWWRIPNSAPRAWIVHRKAVVNSPEAERHGADAAGLESILFVDGRPRDLRQQVVLEADAEATPSMNDPASASDSSQESESCHIVHAAGSRITIDAVLHRAGWLVLNDTYVPGWTAQVCTDHVTHTHSVIRANGIMRCIALPAGDHRVTFRYQPTSVRYGLAISGCAWSVLLAFVMWACAKRLRRHRRVSAMT